MIKVTIIIILILLLVITLYSYYCLSSRMTNFERARLEYILQKESELGTKEKNIKIITDCSNKNEQLENALKNINKILGEIGISCLNKFDDKNVNIVADSEQINKSYIQNKDTSNNINTIINETIGTEILNEVPVEYHNNI